jgi:Mg2+ and Co2+ transporter CorA
VGQRLDESAKLYHELKELTTEKTKYEKKYCSLVTDVNKMMDEAGKRAVEKNLLKMKEKEDDELAEIKRQRNVLMEELALLKQSQKHIEEMAKLRKDKWEKERRSSRKKIRRQSTMCMSF